MLEAESKKAHGVIMLPCLCFLPIIADGSLMILLVVMAKPQLGEKHN
jgi:hypothetical protein